MRSLFRAYLLSLMFSFSCMSFAAQPNWKECTNTANETERLACFDRITGKLNVDRTFLTRAWDLDGNGNPDKEGVRRLEPYRKNYVLVHHTTDINVQPSSPAPLHSVLQPYAYQPDELKFQFSAKSEVGSFRNIDFWRLKDFRLWAAYTQLSFWQLFNGQESSPFRETNHEPELIGTFGTGSAHGWKLLNLGLVHQSNGKPNPDSRSWNRVYLQSGWEWDEFYLMGRAWWRIKETTLQDDNPDILLYVGRAELEAHWSPDREDEVTLLLRSNLSFDHQRGYVELNWSTPINIGHLSRLSLQLSSGYGSSLIDYNHLQTGIGMGLTFKEW